MRDGDSLSSAVSRTIRKKCKKCKKKTGIVQRNRGGGNTAGSGPPVFRVPKTGTACRFFIDRAVYRFPVCSQRVALISSEQDQRCFSSTRRHRLPSIFNPPSRGHPKGRLPNFTEITYYSERHCGLRNNTNIELFFIRLLYVRATLVPRPKTVLRAPAKTMKNSLPFAFSIIYRTGAVHTFIAHAPSLVVKRRPRFIIIIFSFLYPKRMISPGYYVFVSCALYDLLV